MLNEEALLALAARAADADGQTVWPASSWELLRQAGILAWCIPHAYAGQGRSTLELLAGYEALASACLTTCFILSQRDAACRRIRDSRHQALCDALLPRLARGESFATVGLSQLTTSRQHGKPALIATTEGKNFRLDGIMPWVTGAPQADHFITGAVLEDGRQILAALPRTSPGVTVGPPLDLMALQGSLTAEVRCQGVLLENDCILAGPAERVMTIGRGGTGGLETSCLALGLAGAAITFLQKEALSRADLAATARRFDETRSALRQEMHRLAQTSATAEETSALRARANALVLRATEAALTASKGAGFLRQHPAQRWARQALFFLVWSCPALLPTPPWRSWRLRWITNAPACNHSRSNAMPAAIASPQLRRAT